jgi:hypothetical protein
LKGPGEVDLKGTEMLAAVRAWLESRRSWLLILDNADSLDLFLSRDKDTEPDDGTKLTNLYKFVPRGEHGTILWTSRDAHIVGSLVHPKRGVEVGRMDPIESNALFDSLCEHLFSCLPDSIARRKMEVSREGEDGRKMDESLVDIFDLLCPTLSL